MTKFPPGVQELQVPEASRHASGVRMFVADLESLEAPSSLLGELHAEERERASRFASSSAAASFVRRRWLRRTLLANAHGLDPALVNIVSDRLGRPSIVAPPSLRSVWLSTSNAGRYALVAWSSSGPIGVDLAFVDAAHATRDAARVFMTPAELDSWVHGGGGADGFFQCWTRKEAILKAMGTGFATDPTTISAFASDSASHSHARITTLSLPAPPGWMAAISLTASDEHAPRT